MAIGLKPTPKERQPTDMVLWELVKDTRRLVFCVILRADLFQVDQMLRRIPAGRPFEPLTFEIWPGHILEELKSLKNLPPFAFLDVVFGGDPVVESRGIEASFGTS